MKIIHLLGICFLLMGCVTFTEQPKEELDFPRTDLQETSRRFISLRQVHKGMTRKEVQSVLGPRVITGYEMIDKEAGQYKPLTYENPHRTENIQKGKKEFLVDYYLVGIKKQDDQITDDELVPLIYLDNKLIATGWDYLIKKVKN